VNASVLEYARWLACATPLLLLFDLAFGWNVRVAMLDVGRGWYYGALLALSWAAWARASWFGVAALLESTINVVGLLVSAWMQILSSQNALIEGLKPTIRVDWAWVCNFLLVGTLQAIYFYQNLRSLSGAASRSRGRF